MNLGSKIFLAVFFLIAVLLGTTLYFTHSRSEEHEIARLTEDLRLTQLQFQDNLETQQKATLKLVQTLTLDQKFRSFLDQMKDNYYSFMEEIAQDTEADIVFMVDDLNELAGLFPADPATQTWFKKSVRQFAIEPVLEEGQGKASVLSIGNELYSTVYVPLKASLVDDFAVGVVVVCTRIDTPWVDRALGPKMKSSEMQVAFFSQDTLVAGNLTQEAGQALKKATDGFQEETVRFVYSGERYLARRVLFDPQKKSAHYALASNLDRALEPFIELEQYLLSLGGVVIFLGLVFTVLFANRLVKPLKSLVAGTRHVAEGNFDFRIEHHSRDEVGKLSDAFNHMMAGLKEKEIIRESFGKYLNPAIVADILANPDKLKLGGTRQVQSILFSDVANFTGFSEKMSPDQLVKLLNHYLGAMTEELTALKGILDKYIGDAIMAFWGPPFVQGNHANLACQAALNMQRRLTQLRPQWVAEGFPEIHARIGIATGEMIVGNMGSEQSRDYTCIGDTVNYGSRLEGLNKYYGTRILIDEATRKMIGPEFLTRELDTVQVKGREQGAPIFELIGLHDDAPTSSNRWVEDYETALNLYRMGEFVKARDLFTQLHESSVKDPASGVMKGRCCFYLENPPANWIGVHEMQEK